MVSGYFIYPKLPPLKDEYKTFAKELGSFVCNIAGTDQDIKKFSPETFPALVMRFQQSGSQFRSMTQSEVLAKFQTLKEDPLQLGLFVTDVSGQLITCGR